MTTSDADWPLFSHLLEQALALLPGQRAAWLAGLEGEAAACRPRLAALLAREHEADARGFLENPPDFTLPGDEGGSEGQDEALYSAGDAVGPWRLLRLLGRGGMAEVWLAERADGSLARSVALKLPLPGFATGRMAGRFARERDLLASLNHPRIARLYDAGIDGGQPWLAMEWIDGRPLLQWCADEGAGIGQRIDLVLQACDAVQYAHGRLVLHRDIKPNNILVTRAGGLCLLDFGVAKLLRVDPASGSESPSVTQVSGRSRTPDCASPEQIRGEEPGIAADVYAVGVLAYRLFAGVGPYELSRATITALEAAILDQEPRAPSVRVIDGATRRRLRGDLDNIVLRALRKDPGQRYVTVDALAADLRRHLAGLPVLARPSTWRYRAVRYLRRNRWAVAGGGLVAASLLTGSVVASLQARAARAEAARSQAMSKFVLDLFNPGGRTSVDGRIRDRKMSEVIADAAERAGSALVDVPQAREELLANLTELTRGIGLLDASERLRQQRLALQRRLYGDDSDPVLRTQAESVLTLVNSGQTQAGYELAESLLARCERRHCADPTRARLLAAAGDVGRGVHAAPWPLEKQRLEQALALFESNADQLSFLAYGFDALVSLELDLKQFDAAARHARQALEAARAAYGEDGWVTARSKQQLGAVERSVGHMARAAQWQRESIQTMVSQWGDDSNDTARGRLMLVDGLHRSRFRVEALGQARAALAALGSEKNADQHMLRDWAREALLTLGVRRGAAKASMQACEQWFSEVIDSRSQLQVLRSCSELAIALGSAKAVPWTEGLSRHVRAEYGDIPAARWFRLVAEAELSTLQRRPQDAARLLGEAWQVRTADRPDITARWHFDRAVNAVALGEDVTGSKGAGAGVQAAIDDLPVGEDADYFVETRALLLEARGRLLLASGRFDRATADLRASLALRDSIDDGNGLWLRRNLEALAASLQAQGDARAVRAVRSRIVGIDLAMR